MSEDLTQGAVALQAVEQDPRVIADAIVLGGLELFHSVATAMIRGLPAEQAAELRPVADHLARLRQAKLDSLG
ncbi:MAG TPA: hypothetical protein VGV37_12110 [Aliidongia sp.]|uniref:hypothetical protein n=1 Tax=Aliidongia sp. TaxID=1914230 RepID=UPI002DDD27AD|nr:hypothetical protein [Aliidongia sp.]HEV2675278.1 hypothetical protein [Aliidongia sp.]